MIFPVKSYFSRRALVFGFNRRFLAPNNVFPGFSLKKRIPRSKKSPAPWFHAASKAVRRELNAFYTELLRPLRYLSGQEVTNHLAPLLDREVGTFASLGGSSASLGPTTRLKNP